MTETRARILLHGFGFPPRRELVAEYSVPNRTEHPVNYGGDGDGWIFDFHWSAPFGGQGSQVSEQFSAE
jgi:hypothetical protein